jgi:hypothetical protein
MTRDMQTIKGCECGLNRGPHGIVGGTFSQLSNNPWCRFNRHYDESMGSSTAAVGVGQIRVKHVSGATAGAGPAIIPPYDRERAQARRQ